MNQKKKNVFPLYIEEVDRFSAEPILQWEAMLREERVGYVRFDWETKHLTVGVGLTWKNAVRDVSYSTYWNDLAAPDLLTDYELMSRLQKEGIIA